VEAEVFILRRKVFEIILVEHFLQGSRSIPITHANWCFLSLKQIMKDETVAKPSPRRRPDKPIPAPFP
jgi:hypothetical protein